MRKLLVAVAYVALLSSTAIRAEEAKLPKTTEQSAADARAQAEKDAQAAIVAEGAQFIKAGKPAEAAERFDRVIAWYDAKYRDEKRKIYCAGGTAELLGYMLQAAAAKKDAIGLEVTWADAIFLKGFVLIDLGRSDEARAYFERALTLSPDNSQYLSELGEWEKQRKNWQASYDLFARAADVASLAPEDGRQFWQSRAWRGMGFTLTEMGRLDEAEAIYRKCLAADPNDASARHELDYIASVRAHLRGAGKT